MPGGKLHPQVCPQSLDLKCLMKNCDVNLHTRNCQCSTPLVNKEGAGNAVRDGRTGRGARHGGWSTNSRVQPYNQTVGNRNHGGGNGTHGRGDQADGGGVKAAVRGDQARGQFNQSGGFGLLAGHGDHPGGHSEPWLL